MDKVVVARALASFVFLFAFCVKGSIGGSGGGSIANLTAMSFNVDCALCDLGTIDSWAARLKVFE